MLANVFKNLSCDIKTIDRDCEIRKFCQIAFKITFKRAGFIKTEIVHDYKSLNGKNMKYFISFKYSEPYNFEPMAIKIQAVTNSYVGSLRYDETIILEPLTRTETRMKLGFAFMDLEGWTSSRLQSDDSRLNQTPTMNPNVIYNTHLQLHPMCEEIYEQEFKESKIGLDIGCGSNFQKRQFTSRAKIPVRTEIACYFCNLTSFTTGLKLCCKNESGEHLNNYILEKYDANTDSTDLDFTAVIKDQWFSVRRN